MSTLRDLIDAEKEEEVSPPPYPAPSSCSSVTGDVSDEEGSKKTSLLFLPGEEQSPENLKKVTATAAPLLHLKQSENLDKEDLKKSSEFITLEPSNIAEKYLEESEPSYSSGKEVFKTAEKSPSSGTVRFLEKEIAESVEKCEAKGEATVSEESPVISLQKVVGGRTPEKDEKTVMVQRNEFESDNAKSTALKPCPSVGVKLDLLDLNISQRLNGGGLLSPECCTMVEEAWERLKKSYVHFKGKPVGTLAAMDTSADALNYNQVFVRDFVPSGLACLMKEPAEPEIVRNFLLKTLHLQGLEKRVDNFTLGEGVLPASFKVLYDSDQEKETLLVDFGASAIGRVAPVDSGFWWIILLRSYIKRTRDYALLDRPEVQKGMKLILKLCLSDGFDTFPTLLCADGCSMIDRRMGIYGYPIEIQALFYFALSSLVTPAQATAIMDLVEERWEDLIGEMPLKITYPALEGHEWRIVTGFDPKNTRWSYHNGGSWPVLLWLLSAACIKVGRPQIAKRAIELAEQRLSKDGWPEYYDGKTGRYVGKQARKHQTWSIAGYLVAKMMVENPSNLLLISLEEDKKSAKPRLTRSNSSSF
ncbi:unnamed protein product [Dovyalis caffra]|uniref:Alkaline/neutral invertase n=1 Tax=Dovyalis caffra TaxID=77055 RepID=A0AAV1SFR9_9ROSI|nr:unnamed protein product [Dovyalis caffra]